MVKRIKGDGTVSKASLYGDMAYYSAVTVPEEQGMAAQTRAVLKQYDAMLADRKHIVNALVMLAYDGDAEAFFAEWNAWIPAGFEPALTVIRAGLAGGACVSVALNVAEKDDIVRTPLADGTGMLVRYGGIAYFSGRSVDAGESLAAQARAVMRSYDDLLVGNNLKKENILNGNIFVQDIDLQDEYENVWIGWTHIGHKPAGTMVEGRPVQKRHQLELGLTFADGDKVLDIPRRNPGHNCCRAVTYRDVVYFTGNVCIDPDAKGLYEHSKGVFARLQEQLDTSGLKKEDIILCNAYISDAADQPQFERAWDEWVVPGQEPARTVCGTRLLSDTFLIEFTLTVACG